ncbi:MAG: hypothetical protein ABI551_00420, partial [Polyangiaceae bacterium]
ASTLTETPTGTPTPVHPWASRVAVDYVLNARTLVKRFSKHCTLGPAAELRFSLEAEPFATMPGPPFDRDARVVDEGTDDVRIVTGDDHVRLVAFVARKDLHTLTTERADLTALATDDPKDAPIRVAAGVPVELLEAKGDRRRVHLRVHEIDVVGWLPSEKVGTTYTPSAPPTASRIDGEVTPGATVVDARGNVLATFPPPRPSDPPSATNGFYVELRPGAPSGQQAIVWRTEIAEVHGFVAAALVRSIPVTSLYSESGVASGSLGILTDAEPVSVATGASLFTNEGFRVGVVLRRVDGFSGFGGPFTKGELRDVSVVVDGLDFVELYVHAVDIKPR